jgi:filamin
VTGNVKSGFLAEFLPEEVGPHVISVEYNNIPVGGTPFTGSIFKTSDGGLFQLT